MVLTGCGKAKTLVIEHDVKDDVLKEREVISTLPAPTDESYESSQKSYGTAKEKSFKAYLNYEKYAHIKRVNRYRKLYLNNKLSYSDLITGAIFITVFIMFRPLLVEDLY
jgi:nucleoid-associated protein YejK